MIRNYYGIENRFQVKIYYTNIRSAANLTYLAPRSQDNFLCVPCCSQGPTKCNLFVQKKKPVWVM